VHIGGDLTDRKGSLQRNFKIHGYCKSSSIHCDIGEPQWNTIKTKDILRVKQLLGHRRIDSTLVYTQLVSFEGDEYDVKSRRLKEGNRGTAQSRL
jgi:hypothetical protein